MPRGKGPNIKAPGAQGPLTIDPVTLVDHQECVQIHQTVEQVYDQFRHHPHEFAAVLEGTSYVGLISRGHLGFLLGTRYGFTLHSRHLIREHLLPTTLVTTPAVPLLHLLEKALARTGESFYHDVPLVAEDGCFLGIIPVPTLVRAQSALMTQQVMLAESRRSELQIRNQELFQSLNQLRQSQGRYRTLFHHSPLPVALLRSDGTIEAHNARLEAILQGGMADGSDLLKLTHFMSSGHEATFLMALRLHECEAPVPANQPNEMVLRLPQFGERLYRYHMSLVRETGQICTILDDITERRALERRMALNDKAEMFESLVGGIAHELNNKLAPVLGFSDLLQVRLSALGGQGALESYCAAISQSAQESVRIIRQLLQLSRPASMELSQTDLGSLLAEAQSIMRFRIRSAEADLVISLPDEPVTILADASQIKQVLINLLINAIDALEHSPRKQVEVRVGVEGACAVVSVRDTGHGIPADKLTRIFDPFYTTKSAERGTGLGLSVCLGIVRQHRGEITVKSVQGEGTDFRVTLPLASSQRPEAPSVPQPIPFSPGVGVLPTPTSEARHLDVLVVDDEECITSLIQELLRSRLGWRVECVHGGRQAIQRLDEGRFDLVITDLRMPGLDGFAVLGWIRDFRPSLLSRVVVITGDTGSQSLDQELAGFGVPALRKPFKPEELIVQCRAIQAMCG